MDNVRAAILQALPDPAAPARNVARLIEALTRAAAAGARVLVAPELFLTGYHQPDAIAAGAEEAAGPSSEALSAACRRLGTALVYGFAERADGRLYNSALLLGADGRQRAHARKTHLFGEMERRLFTPGDGFVPPVALWDAPEAPRAGLLICFDIEFPEAARAQALAGADWLLVPTALPTGTPQVPQLIVPARAAENGVAIAYANQCGIDTGLCFAGASCLVGPDGGVRARAGEAEALLIADLPARLPEAVRAASPYLASRRPALYRALTDNPPPPPGG